MDCPRCANRMNEESLCRSCPACGSAWFSLAQALRYFGFEMEIPPPGKDRSSWETRRNGLHCPDCQDELVTIVVDKDLVLDQCSGCNGLLFDEGESLALKSKLGSGFGGPSFHKMVQQIVCRQGPYR